MALHGWTWHLMTSNSLSASTPGCCVRLYAPQDAHEHLSAPQSANVRGSVSRSLPPLVDDVIYEEPT